MSSLSMCAHSLLRTRSALVLRQLRPGAVLLEPGVEVVVEVLLGPQHSRQRLAHDVHTVGIVADGRRRDRVIERVGLARRLSNTASKSPKGWLDFAGARVVSRSRMTCVLPATDRSLVMGRDLGPLLRAVHRGRVAMHDDSDRCRP